jgi:hypothetical protein
LRYTSQDILLAALLELSCQQDFIQDVVCLGEREDDVELANIAVVLVHLFDIPMDDLEGDQLVVFRGAAGDEEERGISTIYYLCVYSSSQ